MIQNFLNLNCFLKEEQKKLFSWSLESYPVYLSSFQIIGHFEKNLSLFLFLLEVVSLSRFIERPLSFLLLPSLFRGLSLPNKTVEVRKEISQEITFFAVLENWLSFLLEIDIILSDKLLTFIKLNFKLIGVHFTVV